MRSLVGLEGERSREISPQVRNSLDGVQKGLIDGLLVSNPGFGNSGLLNARKKGGVSKKEKRGEWKVNNEAIINQKSTNQ